MDSSDTTYYENHISCIVMYILIPASVKDADWKVRYAIAKKQALIGVLFHGIKQLPKELAPNADLLMLWMGMAQKIRQQNIRLFMDSAKVCKNFQQEGFRCCILKGQGNALLYPDPYMRTPGDIDIYLGGGRKREFGLSEDKMIAPIDEKEGKFLLEGIMRGGTSGSMI